MHDLIEELQAYHKEKAHHLFELEKGVANLSEKGDFATRSRTVQALFDSFCSSSEQVHHHNEETILAELQLTRAPIHRRVKEISGDHQAFGRISKDIQLKIASEEVSLDELRAAIDRFVAIYKDHANGEEDIFFPIADQYLEARHWQKIKKKWK